MVNKINMEWNKPASARDQARRCHFTQDVFVIGCFAGIWAETLHHPLWLRTSSILCLFGLVSQPVTQSEDTVFPTAVWRRLFNCCSRKSRLVKYFGALVCGCLYCRSAQVLPSGTAEGIVLSLYSTLTVTSSLFPTSSSGSALPFLLKHTCAHAGGFGPLDLGCHDSSTKGCAEVSACLFDESRRLTGPGPPSTGVLRVCV